MTAPDALGYGTRFMWHRIPVGLALLALVVAACGSQQRTGEGAPAPVAAGGSNVVVVRYAGKTMDAAEVLAAMKRLPGPSRVYLSSPERKRQFIDNLVTNELLFEQGKQQGFADDPDVEQQVEDFRERLVVQRVMRDLRQRPEVSDEEAKQQYDANPELYSTTQIRASHILVKDEETATAIRAERAEHPERFADIAKERSTDLGTGRRGGDLGKFGPGRMVPEFERAAFALQPGEISEPVKTQYGYHIILVTERVDGAPRPFEQVKVQIKSQIANQRLQEKLATFMDELKAKADIQIDEAALDALQPPPPDPNEATASRIMGH